MSIAIMEMICGIILTGIIPPILIIAEEKKNSKEKKRIYGDEQEKWIMTRILFSVTVFFVIVSILIQENINLLFGVILGSSLFYLLVLNGVNRIASERRYFLMDNYQGGKYLIFGMVLLLFLSADYLLTGKTDNNIISRADGMILIAVYLLFYFVVHINGNKENIKNKWQNLKKRKVLDNEFFQRKKRRGIINCIILLSVAAGSYFLTAGIGLLSIALSQPQYFMGVLFGGIAVNISSGILISISRNESTKYNQQTIENVIFVNTFLLGCSVAIREIHVSQYMIYMLMFFCFASIVLEGLRKIDNRLAGSGMVTVYIGIIMYIILHH